MYADWCTWSRTNFVNVYPYLLASVVTHVVISAAPKMTFAALHLRQNLTPGTSAGQKSLLSLGDLDIHHDSRMSSPLSRRLASMFVQELNLSKNPKHASGTFTR